MELEMLRFEVNIEEAISWINDAIDILDTGNHDCSKTRDSIEKLKSVTSSLKDILELFKDEITSESMEYNRQFDAIDS